MIELLLLLGVLVLVALNGYFVAAEFALVRSREPQMQVLADEGKRGAKLALKQMGNLSEYLSACQLGITLTSLGIGFMGEPAIASLAEEGLGEALPHGVTLAVSFGIAYLITTALHITLGEQVPKIFAIVHAENVARRIARGLELFRVVFKPLIVESVTGGKLDEDEAGMLSGVFHLHEQEARQVMTPIPAVVTVDVSENAEESLRRCVDSGHTRLVVTEGGNDDRIRGIVHANSLARRLMVEGPEASIEQSVKDAHIIPETKPLDDLLRELQRERMSLAVVVDEYGRTAGIVTVEDIVEEVVGEIADETDPAVAGVRRLSNGDWWVRGHVPITDLADYGLDMPAGSDAFNSVGGFVFAELGRLPKRGDMVRANGYSLRVESVRENRIEAVRTRDHHPGPEAAEPPELEVREATEGAYSLPSARRHSSAGQDMWSA